MKPLLFLLAACAGPSQFVGTWQGQATIELLCRQPLPSTIRDLTVVVAETENGFTVEIDGCTAAAELAPESTLQVSPGCASKGGRFFLKGQALDVVFATSSGPCTETTRGGGLIR